MIDISPILAGNRLALARLLTQIENDTPAGRASLQHLYPHTGRAYLIGVTGPPGTGKSSLVHRLAFHYRHPPQNQQPQKIAIVAVDPTSPFSGGAVLGDRVRMRDLAGDAGVFIRSMASRGALGGLAATTAGVVQAFDAAGYDLIIIETVGAGQAEVDIARLAHTTVVIEAPGLGDDIQAIKAGILEIADILVVNKADRPGADQTERALKNMLNLAHPAPKVFYHHGNREVLPEVAAVAPESTEIWLPPIQRTVATAHEGIAELAGQIEQHRQFLIRTEQFAAREKARIQAHFEQLIQETLMNRLNERIDQTEYAQLLDQLTDRQISLQQAVLKLIDGAII